jgi:hemolysin III
MKRSDVLNEIKPFWFMRQPISGLSHLFGAVLSVVGLMWMLRDAIQLQHFSPLIAAIVFGFSMVCLYTSSALYHLLPFSERWVQRLRKLDHAMIYVFIAGCYTPMCLIAFKSKWGLVFCLGVWGLAAIGVFLKLLWLERSRWMRILMYHAMGWLSLVLLPSLIQKLPTSGLVWLFIGGGAYGVGSLVYATRRPSPFPRFFGFHEIWHVMVLLGSFCHFWMVKNYVLYL